MAPDLLRSARLAADTPQIAAGQIIAVTRPFHAAVRHLLCCGGAVWGSPERLRLVSIPVASLAGLAFGLPLMAYAASIKEDKGQFAMVMRFIVMPLFLFSGTFFPLDTLPLAVRWIGWISPIWHGTELGRVFTYGYQEEAAADDRPTLFSCWPSPPAAGSGQARVHQKDGRMSALTKKNHSTSVHSDTETARNRKFGPLYSRNVRAVVARGLMATKSSNWMVMLSGFFEPVLFLISMGVGLGAVDEPPVQGPSSGEISYAAYIAPALLAVSAMNGAVYDSTWNVFFKMNFAKLYQGMLYTSLGPLDVAMGEIFLALLRGA